MYPDCTKVWFNGCTKICFNGCTKVPSGDTDICIVCSVHTQRDGTLICSECFVQRNWIQTFGLIQTFGKPNSVIYELSCTWVGCTSMAVLINCTWAVFHLSCTRIWVDPAYLAKRTFDSDWLSIVQGRILCTMYVDVPAWLVSMCNIWDYQCVPMRQNW